MATTTPEGMVGYNPILPGQTTTSNESGPTTTPSGFVGYNPILPGSGSPGANPSPSPDSPTPTVPTPTTAPPTTVDHAGLGGMSGLQLATWALQQVAGFSPADASQLATYYMNFFTTQGITDPTTMQEYIGADLPSQPVFQKNFPGYADAIGNGYVRSIGQYVQAEEGITAVMLQGGVPKDMINPTSVGGLISQGVSVNEVAQRVNNGLDAAMNAPAEVQNYFLQQFGTGQGTNALATVFLNPNIDDVTLMKMYAGSQIRGAAAASNLTIGQGLSQRLADQGQTYSSAQSAFKNLTAQAGLFEQTVGENSSQTPVPGTQNANLPLDVNNQGVSAAFGLDANAVQQVHQTALARENEFRGGGGASTTQAEGFSGLAQSKSS
jgi:hypothetical protein